uniref:G_PROTEIN_RECEP_F1_2 domain-containing protein n=1 Tax=Steinernema glaseri TaxID=37863 RepID=A0A1I7YXE8_9BILA
MSSDISTQWLTRDGYKFTSESCQVAKELAESSDLRVTLVLRITLFLVGFLLFAAFLYANNSLTLYHANARLLFRFNYLWVFMQSLTYITLHVYDLIRFSKTHTDPCDYLIPAWLSVLMRALPNVASYGQCWAMFTLALERSVATYASVPYEQSNNTTLGLFMVFAQIVMPLLWIYALVHDYAWDELKITCTVSSAKTNGLFQILTAVLACVEIVTIVLLCTLFVINKYLQYQANRRLTAPNKLAHKFQVDLKERLESCEISSLKANISNEMRPKISGILDSSPTYRLTPTEARPMQDEGKKNVRRTDTSLNRVKIV